MRDSILKFLTAKLGSLTQFYFSLNFYQGVISEIEAKKIEAQEVYDGYKKLIDDPESRKTLTHPELEALATNARNYKGTLSEFSGALEHLITNKHTTAIRIALYHLEDLRIDVKDLASSYYDLNDLAKEVDIKDVIEEKKFNRADYKGKLGLLLIATGNIRDDVRDGDLGEGEFVQYNKWNIIKTLGKLEIILQEELELVENQGMPKSWDPKLPDIVEPVIPESPDEKSDLEVKEAETIKLDPKK